MAAGNWTFPTGAIKKLTDGTIDLDTDVLMIALANSSWSTATTAYSTTNEASGTGYSAGGATLASVTLVESGGTLTLDCADPTWDATGGSLTAKYAYIYSDTAAGKDIIAYIDLNTASSSAVATASDEAFTITIAAGGILTIAAA